VLEQSSQASKIPRCPPKAKGTVMQQSTDMTRSVSPSRWHRAGSSSSTAWGSLNRLERQPRRGGLLGSWVLRYVQYQQTPTLTTVKPGSDLHQRGFSPVCSTGTKLPCRPDHLQVPRLALRNLALRHLSLQTLPQISGALGDDLTPKSSVIPPRCSRAM
jgi:hypothetical protein